MRAVTVDGHTFVTLGVVYVVVVLAIYICTFRLLSSLISHFINLICYVN
jgi:Na+-transporting methylmalonyl-CoA/oxaloacetate decarboxylase gamma subunit